MMTEIEINSEQNTSDIKLFSSRAIGGATFLGGPLAAGYMIGENYKALNKPKAGKNAFILGILSTIALFWGLLAMPDSITNKIPNQIIPLIYTALLVGFVEWKQGSILKIHKENGNSFFSGWRAAGIGFISLLIIGVGIVGYSFSGLGDEIYYQYDQEINIYAQNEVESLAFYDHLETETNYALLNELDEIAIPKWKANIQIIEGINSWGDLPEELRAQNEVLLKYSELRLEAFLLFKSAISANTDGFSTALEKVHQEIERQLIQLN
jgi:hypothetical protein